MERAKEFYVAMGCSGFQMSRAYPHRYREYQNLQIPHELERIWTYEQVHVLVAEIAEATDRSRVWRLHSALADRVSDLPSPDAMQIMLHVTQDLPETVPLVDRVMVSETINGRRQRRFRSGLIYRSYDLRLPRMAKQFADLSIYFARDVAGQTGAQERCHRATRTCQDITAELGI